ncbi:MAG: DUF2087 domain-containing protein [Clostridia bacterium]|nr:DUF2087 domain-containing protein [Clostridia bacterium]
MKESWRNRLLVANGDTVQRGYDNSHRCLFCEAQSPNEAKASEHLAQTHGSVLDALLALDKALTGLTDTQKTLIRRWRDGTADAELAAERGVSVSTLRNQRFALREREREARLLLAVLSLAGLSTLQKPAKVAKGGDDGVAHFYRDGKLTQMPARHAKKRAVMLRFFALFEPERVYSDQEVKELIAPIWPDYAEVRRFLCDTGLLQRTKDGRSYWRASQGEQSNE